MTRSWKSILFAIILLAAAVPPPAAQAQTQTRTYPAFGVDIPFKFAVGPHTFSPGNYQFAVLGPALLAVVNTKTRVVVRLLTRDAPAGEATTTTGVIFTKDKKGRAHMTSVRLEGHARGLQIIGEEVAMRQNPPQFQPQIPMELFVPRELLPQPSNYRKSSY